MEIYLFSLILYVIFKYCLYVKYYILNIQIRSHLLMDCHVHSHIINGIWHFLVSEYQNSLNDTNK